jgi:hypothetical protein
MENKFATRLRPLKWLLFGVFLAILAAAAVLMTMPHTGVPSQ